MYNTANKPPRKFQRFCIAIDKHLANSVDFKQFCINLRAALV